MRFLRNNSALKLLAILLATTAWYAIRKATSNETLVKNVPLRFLMDDGWAVLDQSTAGVDVQFSGSLADLRSMVFDQLSVQVDQRGKKTESGTIDVKLKARNVRGSGNARPVRLDPEDVRVTFDRESDKEVVVKADIVGSPPEGIEMNRVICTPSTVKLRGPQQRVDEIKEVLTAPIDLEGRIRSFQLSKPIKSPGDKWTARIQPEEVRVEVDLVERLAQREIHDVPVRALMLPDQRGAVSFSPAVVSVVVEGPGERLKAMDLSKVVAFADCTALGGAATGEVPVRVSTGAGYRSLSVTPETVRVELAEP